MYVGDKVMHTINWDLGIGTISKILSCGAIIEWEHGTSMEPYSMLDNIPQACDR